MSARLPIGCGWWVDALSVSGAWQAGWRGRVWEPLGSSSILGSRGFVARLNCRLSRLRGTSDAAPFTLDRGGYTRRAKATCGQGRLINALPGRFRRAALDPPRSRAASPLQAAALSRWCGGSSKHREAVPYVVGCGGGRSGVGGGGRCAQAAAAGFPHPPLSDRQEPLLDSLKNKSHK